MESNRPFALITIIIFCIAVFVVSCAQKKGTLLPIPNVATTQQTLLILTGDANHKSISSYDLDGNHLDMITSYRITGGTLRGLTSFDLNSFLVSIDGTDRIERVFLDGTVQTFYDAGFLSGEIYEMKQASNGNIYVYEDNGVEVFDSTGARLASSYIPITVGACSIHTPRGIEINSSGNLIVANTGGSDNILTYDISNPAATCLSAVPFGNNPQGVVAHSNGNLYVITEITDQVYSADADGSNQAIVWPANLAIIDNPTDILELPNGDLIVSSSGTDTIERITVNGFRVGTDPFISDGLTLNVQDMAIMEMER